MPGGGRKDPGARGYKQCFFYAYAVPGIAGQYLEQGLTIAAETLVEFGGGKIEFIDREIDPMTGAILIQASFPNPDELLRPGQFGKIRITKTAKEEGILIPQPTLYSLSFKGKIHP